MVFRVVIPCPMTLVWASDLSEDIDVSQFRIVVG